MLMNKKLDKAESGFLHILSSCINNTAVPQMNLCQQEWEEVVRIARAHNVFPLIFEKASENESFVSLPEYQQYAFEVMSIVAGQARRTEAFLSLYKEFVKADIHPIVMKGLICRQLYEEYCDHRPSGDEDILIQKSEFELVQQILVKNGYYPDHENIKVEQLEDLQEVTFFNTVIGLSIEVHVNPIGHEDNWRRQLNDCFKNVFQNRIDEVVDDVAITTMGYTDHMLFLILHAFKHLTAGGFGIRQVLDILIYAEKYESVCNWEHLCEVLTGLKAELFLQDLFYIGEKYLGFHMEGASESNCPDDLLAEILSCGVFGNATQAQRTATQMTSSAMQSKRKDNFSNLSTWFYTVFPAKSQMLSFHPELQEKPWLLPVCWVKRWGRFLAHNKANGGNLAAESMKISKRRIELLKKYDIL